ncbi:MAG: hypothetical protein JRJ75_16685 [Deltaproteobacteria bacterium]|nr:hypothetical protein [Deltaproteobacteria bacterium]
MKGIKDGYLDDDEKEVFRVALTDEENHQLHALADKVQKATTEDEQSEAEAEFNGYVMDLEMKYDVLNIGQGIFLTFGEAVGAQKIDSRYYLVVTFSPSRREEALEGWKMFDEGQQEPLFDSE